MENQQIAPKHLIVFGVVILALGIVAGPAVLGILSHRDDAATRTARRATDGGNGGAGDGAAGGGGYGGGFDPQVMQARAAERLELMTNELHLSADQKVRVKAIQDGAMPARIAIMQNPSLSREQMREHMRPIRADTESRIQRVLTPGQQTQYRVFQLEMRARFGGYPGGGYPGPR